MSQEVVVEPEITRSDHIPKCCHGNVAKDCYFCIMDEDNNGFTYHERPQSTPRKPIQRKLLSLTSWWRHDDAILTVKWRQNNIELIAQEERLKQSWLLRNGNQLQNLKLGLAVRYSYFMIMTKFSCPNRQIDCQNKTWNEKSSLEHVYLRYITVKWFIWRFSWSSCLSYRA